MPATTPGKGNCWKIIATEILPNRMRLTNLAPYLRRNERVWFDSNEGLTDWHAFARMVARNFRWLGRSSEVKVRHEYSNKARVVYMYFNNVTFSAFAGRLIPKLLRLISLRI